MHAQTNRKQEINTRTVTHSRTYSTQAKRTFPEGHGEPKHQVPHLAASTSMPSASACTTGIKKVNLLQKSHMKTS